MLFVRYPATVMAGNFNESCNTPQSRPIVVSQAAAHYLHSITLIFGIAQQADSIKIEQVHFG